MTKDFTVAVSESQEALLEELGTLLHRFGQRIDQKESMIGSRALLATYTEQIESRLRELLADADRLLSEAWPWLVSEAPRNPDHDLSKIARRINALRTRIAKETR